MIRKWNLSTRVRNCLERVVKHVDYLWKENALVYKSEFIEMKNDLMSASFEFSPMYRSFLSRTESGDQLRNLISRIE